MGTESLRERLTMLPSVYDNAVAGLIGATAENARLRVQKEQRKMKLLAPLAEKWKDKAQAGNKESRDAEADAELANDTEYQDIDQMERDTGERIMIWTKRCEVLKFEFGCLKTLVDLGKPQKEGDGGH